MKQEVQNGAGVIHEEDGVMTDLGSDTTKDGDVDCDDGVSSYKSQ